MMERRKKPYEGETPLPSPKVFKYKKRLGEKKNIYKTANRMIIARVK